MFWEPGITRNHFIDIWSRATNSLDQLAYTRDVSQDKSIRHLVLTSHTLQQLTVPRRM